MLKSTRSPQLTQHSISARVRASHERVRAVRLQTFAVAHQIIGGGEEGDKRLVRTKEEADHSLPYILAVALIDGEVQPRQYEPARIRAADVQMLLRKVTVTANAALSAQFPQLLPARKTARFFAPSATTIMAFTQSRLIGPRRERNSTVSAMPLRRLPSATLLPRPLRRSMAVRSPH
jgi:2-methylcitrate dehydratase PrpD